jgi:hypothetical protein
MTAAGFKRWMLDMGYSIAQAAEALDISERQISYYRSGEQAVPKVVELACRYLAQERRSR